MQCFCFRKQEFRNRIHTRSRSSSLSQLHLSILEDHDREKGNENTYDVIPATSKICNTGNTVVSLVRACIECYGLTKVLQRQQIWICSIRLERDIYEQDKMTELIRLMITFQGTMRCIPVNYYHAIVYDAKNAAQSNDPVTCCCHINLH